jgi:hypothetical protein
MPEHHVEPPQHTPTLWRSVYIIDRYARIFKGNFEILCSWGDRHGDANIETGIPYTWREQLKVIRGPANLEIITLVVENEGYFAFHAQQALAQTSAVNPRINRG